MKGKFERQRPMTLVGGGSRVGKTSLLASLQLIALVQPVMGDDMADDSAKLRKFPKDWSLERCIAHARENPDQDWAYPEGVATQSAPVARLSNVIRCGSISKPSSRRTRMSNETERLHRIDKMLSNIQDQIDTLDEKEHYTVRAAVNNSLTALRLDILALGKATQAVSEPVADTMWRNDAVMAVNAELGLSMDNLLKLQRAFASASEPTQATAGDERELGQDRSESEKKSCIYLMYGPENSVSLSGYQCDDPKYEANHWDVRDYFAPMRMAQGSLMLVLTNVFRDAGIHFIEE